MEKAAVGKANTSSILCALDVNRSLSALCATALPGGTRLDGEDLSSTLLGRERRSRNAPLFSVPLALTRRS